MSWRLRPGVFALLAGVLCTGCGSVHDGMVPVAGQVTVDGRPLATGRVLFRPDPARGNDSPHHPMGTIAADGSYRLHTGGKPAAPLGWYRVLVFAGEPSPHPSGASPGVPRWLVHERYTQEHGVLQE